MPRKGSYIASDERAFSRQYCVRNTNTNFGFLKPHGAQLYRLAALAEHYFPIDPNTSLFKLRQFAELLAQDVAASAGLYSSTEEPFTELLGRLSRSGYAPRRALDLFHHLRMAGNAAAHKGQDDFDTALSALKVGRELAVWFVRAFSGKPELKVGPFTPPTVPAGTTESLRNELARLKTVVAEHRSAAERELARAVELEARSRTAEEQAAKEAEDRATWQRLAEEAEAESNQVREELETLQHQAEQLRVPALALLIHPK
jgi:type I restriction enzyme, R subunit